MANGATITKSNYGTTADGKAVDQYTLTNVNGMEVKIITYGGTITSVKAPDRYGNLTNVVLGFSKLEDYETCTANFFGALIGRFGNRIDGGKFTLDGVEYTLASEQRSELAAWRGDRFRQSHLVGESQRNRRRCRP